jgi:hypothetical protein
MLAVTRAPRYTLDNMRTPFTIGSPFTSAELVGVLKRCFPKMPPKASQASFKRALGFLGKSRFEHEVNVERGIGLNTRQTADGVYEVVL